VPLAHAPDAPPGAPGLHFVGFDVTLGGMLRAIGRQAQALARVVAP
jgi:hypothetical protein